MDKISVVNVLAPTDNHYSLEAKLSCALAPKGGRPPAPRTQQGLAFCVLGRCFVKANAQADARGVAGPVRADCRELGYAGRSAPGRLHKASSSLGVGIDAAAGLHRPLREQTGVFGPPAKPLTVATVAGVTRTPQVAKAKADTQRPPQGDISRQDPLGSRRLMIEAASSNARHTAKSPHHGAVRSQEVIGSAPATRKLPGITGHGSLIKAP